MQAWLKTFETEGVKLHFLLKTSHGGSATLSRRIRRSGNVQPRAAAFSGRRPGRRPGSAPQPLRASGNPSDPLGAVLTASAANKIVMGLAQMPLYFNI